MVPLTFTKLKQLKDQQKATNTLGAEALKLPAMDTSKKDFKIFRQTSKFSSKRLPETQFLISFYSLSGLEGLNKKLLFSTTFSKLLMLIACRHF